jgi:hypothetical protein
MIFNRKALLNVNKAQHNLITVLISFSNPHLIMPHEPLLNGKKNITEFFFFAVVLSPPFCTMAKLEITLYHYILILI